MSPYDSTTFPSTSSPDIKLIDLRSAVREKTPWRLFSGLIGPAEYFLAINKINAIHRSLPPGMPAGEFCRHVLKELNIDYALTEEELSAIPAGGPLVVAANHPFGGVEGIILAEILPHHRTRAQNPIAEGNPDVFHGRPAGESKRVQRLPDHCPAVTRHHA